MINRKEIYSFESSKVTLSAVSSSKMNLMIAVSRLLGPAELLIAFFAKILQES